MSETRTTTQTIDELGLPSALTIPDSLSAGTQQTVQDATGVKSALTIGTERVSVVRPGAVPGPQPFNVIISETGPGPMVLLGNDGREASIRYHAGKGSAAAVWHVGTLNDGVFFFWHPDPNVGFAMSLKGKTTTIRELRLPELPRTTATGLKQVVFDPATGQLFYQ